jgi:hypothetical protein
MIVKIQTNTNDLTSMNKLEETDIVENMVDTSSKDPVEDGEPDARAEELTMGKHDLGENSRLSSMVVNNR